MKVAGCCIDERGSNDRGIDVVIDECVIDASLGYRITVGLVPAACKPAAPTAH